MIIKTFVLPPLDNNNYLIIDEVTKDAALVDCSSFDDSVITALADNSAKLKYILLTHAHFDHVLGIEKMVEETGATVVLHSDDEFLLKDLNSYTFMTGMPAVNIPKVNKFIADGEVIELGSLKIKAIHTPGHTRGGVSYLVEDNLFSGDTLFRESIGRTDLEGGNFKVIETSIRQKLFTLYEDTVVYPGHGPSTTVRHEKKFNSYV